MDLVLSATHHLQVLGVISSPLRSRPLMINFPAKAFLDFFFLGEAFLFFFFIFSLFFRIYFFLGKSFLIFFFFLRGVFKKIFPVGGFEIFFLLKRNKKSAWFFFSEQNLFNFFSWKGPLKIIFAEKGLWDFFSWRRAFEIYFSFSEERPSKFIFSWRAFEMYFTGFCLPPPRSLMVVQSLDI